MKAMVFAAGLGTRLRPLTNDRPKALVEVAGRTMLEIILTRLQTFGVDEVIINTHHYADTIRDYLNAQNSFGMNLSVSREEILLDTGGGLKKAAWFFLDRGGEEPFLVHNVDVISNIDLARMVEAHTRLGALATLAVQARKTKRPLLFDRNGYFRGRAVQDSSEAEAGMMALAFSGIHVISPRIFEKITEDGVFSIISCYVRLAAQGEKIAAFRADDYYWRDLGRPENLLQAAHDLESGAIQLA